MRSSLGQMASHGGALLGIRRVVVAFFRLAVALVLLAPSARAAPVDGGSPHEAASRAPGPGPDFGGRLAPYGDWLSVGGLGLVWRPRDVPDDWRPFSRGAWRWDERNWVWVGDEPWGWATNHYGCWAFHPRYGWVWRPGTTWSPARVVWRWNAQVVGWAPITVDGKTLSSFWTFVPASRLGGSVIAGAIPAPRIPALLAPGERVGAPAPGARHGSVVSLATRDRAPASVPTR